MPWRALIINGTFLEVLATHRPQMEQTGLAIVPVTYSGGNLPLAQVQALGTNVDVIFGPGLGLDADFFRLIRRLKVVSLASSGYDTLDVDIPSPCIVDVLIDVCTPIKQAMRADQ